MLKGIVAPLDQDSNSFDFSNSRSISNDPNSTEGSSEGSIEVMDMGIEGSDVVDDKDMLECMRGSVLVSKNDDGAAATVG